MSDVEPHRAMVSTVRKGIEKTFEFLSTYISVCQAMESIALREDFGIEDIKQDDIECIMQMFAIKVYYEDFDGNNIQYSAPTLRIHRLWSQLCGRNLQRYVKFCGEISYEKTTVFSKQFCFDATSESTQATRVKLEEHFGRSKDRSYGQIIEPVPIMSNYEGMNGSSPIEVEESDDEEERKKSIEETRKKNVEEAKKKAEEEAKKKAEEVIEIQAKLKEAREKHIQRSLLVQSEEKAKRIKNALDTMNARAREESSDESDDELPTQEMEEDETPSGGQRYAHTVAQAHLPEQEQENNNDDQSNQTNKTPSPPECSPSEQQNEPSPTSPSPISSPISSFQHEATSSPTKYVLHEKITSNFWHGKKHSKFFSGVITTVHDNDTYDIMYDTDGIKSRNVSYKFILKQIKRGRGRPRKEDSNKKSKVSE